ncbi:MAG: hypothetical protein Q9203_004861 [Teloschistes exilis]
MLQVLPVGIQRGLVDKHVLSTVRKLEVDGLVVRGPNLSRSAHGPRINPSGYSALPSSPLLQLGSEAIPRLVVGRIRVHFSPTSASRSRYGSEDSYQIRSEQSQWFELAEITVMAIVTSQVLQTSFESWIALAGNKMCGDVGLLITVKIKHGSQQSRKVLPRLSDSRQAYVSHKYALARACTCSHQLVD